MTLLIVEPDEIITEFIRAQLTEPQRDGLSNRQINKSETFTGDGSTTSFEVTNKPLQCVNSVTVGGTEQAKYIAYDIDLRNGKVIFGTAPANAAEIVVDYDYGSSWVFPDKPRDDLNESAFPRIGILALTQPEDPMGAGTGGPYWLDGTYQIDCVAYKGQKCTISSEVREGQDLANYIAREVIKALTSASLTALQQKLFNLRILNHYPVPFDEETNVFRKIVEIELNAQNIGR